MLCNFLLGIITVHLLILLANLVKFHGVSQTQIPSLEVL